MKKTLFVIVLGVSTLISCKKNDSSNNNATPTKENIVGNWKQVGETMNGTSTWANKPACEKDDLTQFKNDNTYSYTDAGTVCNPNGSFTGAWSVSGNTITIDGSAMTISSFDGSNMAVTESYTSMGQTYTYVYSFVKQ